VSALIVGRGGFKAMPYQALCVSDGL